MRHWRLRVCMILAGLLGCHSLGIAGDARSAWWNQEYPLRVEVEVRIPAPLCTEQPVAVPVDWRAGAAKGLDLDWRYGKAIEITNGEAKEAGYCQRSSVVDVEPASVKAAPEDPLGKKERATAQQTYHLTFILPPRKDAPVRKFHLYFPSALPDDEMREPDPPIRVADKLKPVRGGDPIKYHEVTNRLATFSLNPGWNSAAGVVGFRANKDLSFRRLMRFYRMGYDKRTVSPPFHFQPLEVGSVRATFLMSASDGSVPHRFLWHIYSNGDFHVRHRWIEGTQRIYWIVAEGANIAYWQFEMNRFPQEMGKKFLGSSSRFVVQHSPSGNSMTYLFDGPVAWIVPFSNLGRWESLMVRYRKVGLDDAFDDAEALCEWQGAEDMFRVGGIETLEARKGDR